MIDIKTTATMLIYVDAIPTDTFALRILEAHLHNESSSRWVGSGGCEGVCDDMNRLGDERRENLRKAIAVIMKESKS